PLAGAFGTDGEQGYEPNPLIRKRVEDLAVAHATTYYSGLGFAVENVGNRECYDLICRRTGVPDIRVEVKGTRSRGKTVILTAPEVQHAVTAQDYRVDLYVVYGVSVEIVDGVLSATGGESRMLEAWRPATEHLTPTQYRYRLP